MTLLLTQAWFPVRKTLLWLAHLTWINVALLALTIAVMSAQIIQTTASQLPQQAPASLPAGVIGLAGWADRLIVLAFCLWVARVAWRTIQLQRRQSACSVQLTAAVTSDAISGGN